MATLNELRTEKEALRTELEMRVLQEQINGLKGLRESWSAADEDWPTIGRDGLSPTGSVRGTQQYQTRRGDWDQGAYPILYTTEQDIWQMLANVRNLATFDSIFIGAGEALQSYTLGGEWEWKAAPLIPECPPMLVEMVQREVDKFIEYNDWQAELDQEIHDVSREDGDVLVGLYAEGDDILCKYTTAEFLTEPQNKRDLDYYANTDQLTTAWWFGVHIAWNDVIKTWNWERPLGYHVCYDEAGNNWDYLPVEPVMRVDDDMRCGVHIKRNVPRRALRGVSDYWPVWSDLEGLYKLYKGTRDGATLQSYIAYIIQHAEGTTKENVSQSLDDDPLWKYTAAKSAQTVARHKRLRSGSIIHTDQHQQYQASPMGSLSQPVFIDVHQAGLRRLSVRWNMPEYLISGDASNANYASTLSAGSPFVKSRQRDQAFYRRKFRQVFMRMLQMRCLQNAFGMSWEMLRKLVDVQPEAPDVDIQNILELTQRRALLNERGVLDAQTWASLEELDPEKVTASQVAAEYGDAPMEGEPVVSTDGAPTNVEATDALNGAQITAAKDVLAGVSDGSTTIIVAFELLVALGIKPERANRMVASAAQNATQQAQKDQQQATGEMSGIGRRQWKNNVKAIDDVLQQLIGGVHSEAKARTLLAALGVSPQNVDALILDAKDGVIDTVPESARFEMARQLLWEGYP